MAPPVAFRSARARDPSPAPRSAGRTGTVPFDSTIGRVPFPGGASGVPVRRPFRDRSSNRAHPGGVSRSGFRPQDPPPSPRAPA